MRYLVTAKVKPGCDQALDQAIETGALGQGSVAGAEYYRNMEEARLLDDGRIQWVEVCHCSTPLAEERPHLGEILRSAQGAGSARAQPLPRSQRLRKLGL